MSVRMWMSVRMSVHMWMRVREAYVDECTSRGVMMGKRAHCWRGRKRMRKAMNQPEQQRLTINASRGRSGYTSQHDATNGAFCEVADLQALLLPPLQLPGQFLACFKSTTLIALTMQKKHVSDWGLLTVSS